MKMKLLYTFSLFLIIQISSAQIIGSLNFPNGNNFEITGAATTVELSISSTTAIANQVFEISIPTGNHQLYFGVSSTLPSGVTMTGPGGVPQAIHQSSRLISINNIQAGVPIIISLQVTSGCGAQTGTYSSAFELRRQVSSSWNIVALAYNAPNQNIVVSNDSFLNPSVGVTSTNGGVSVNGLSIAASIGDVITRRYDIINTSNVVYNGWISINDNLESSVLEVLQVTYFLQGTPTPIGSSTALPYTHSVNIPANGHLIIEEQIRVRGCLHDLNSVDHGSTLVNIQWGRNVNDICTGPGLIDGTINRANIEPSLSVVEALTNDRSETTCFGTASANKSIVFQNNLSASEARNVKIQMICNQPFSIPKSSLSVTITRYNSTTQLYDASVTFPIDYDWNNLTNSTNPDFEYDLASLNAERLSLGKPPYVDPPDASPLFGSNGTTLKSTKSINNTSHYKNGYWANYFITAAELLSISPEYWVTNANLGDNTVIVQRLIVERLMVNGQSTPISLNPGDRISINWVENTNCMKNQSIINNFNATCFNVHYYNECGAEKSLDRVHAPFNTKISHSVQVGNYALEGNPDYCSSSSDGQIEDIVIKSQWNKFSLPYYQSGQSINGKFIMRVWLQDGLDLNYGLDQQHAWNSTSALGTLTATSCLNTCSTCTPAIYTAAGGNNITALTNRYSVYLGGLANGNLLPERVQLIQSQSPSSTPVNSELVVTGGTSYNANYLYEIEFDLSQFNFTSQEQLLNYFSGFDIHISVRAYCTELDKSNVKVVTYYQNCGSNQSTSCSTGFVNMFPVSTFSTYYQVNCPGCKVPGSEVMDKGLRRVELGYEDNDHDKGPDNFPNSTSLSTANLLSATNGDHMDAYFQVTMSSGTNVTIQNLKDRNFYLDHLYVNIKTQGDFIVEEAYAYLETDPNNDLPAQPQSAWGAALTILPNGLIRIPSSRFSESDYYFLSGGKFIAIKVRLKVNSTLQKETVKEITYEAGFSTCNSCDAVSGTAYTYNASTSTCTSNISNSSTTLVSVSNNGAAVDACFNLNDIAPLSSSNVRNNAFFWCTNSGSKVKIIPYIYSAKENVYDVVDNVNCYKKYILDISGNYRDSEGSVNYDAYPGEFRQYLIGHPLKYNLPIPDGYELYQVSFTNQDYGTADTDHPANYHYTESYVLTDPVALNNLINPNNNQPGYAKAFTYTANFAYNAHTFTFNGEKWMYSEALTSMPPLWQVRDENFKFRIECFFKPANCSIADVDLKTDFTNRNFNIGTSLLMNTLDDRFNPGNITSLTLQSPIILLPVGGYFNQMGNEFTTPVTNLVVGADQLNLPVTSQQIVIPFHITNTLTTNAIYPFVHIYGAAINKPGLVFKGIRKAGSSDFMDLSNKADLTDQNKGYLISIDHTETELPANRDPELLNGRGYYELVFEFDCNVAQCNPGLTCGDVNPLSSNCLTAAEIKVRVGSSCVGLMDSFSKLSSQQCGISNEIVFKLSNQPIAIKSTYTIPSVINSCTNFNADIVLASCFNGSINSFDIDWIQIPSGLSISSVPASIIFTENNQSYTFTIANLGSNKYRVSCSDPVDFNLNNQITIPFTFAALCEFGSGTLKYKVSAPNYCGSLITTPVYSAGVSVLDTPTGLDAFSNVSLQCGVPGQISVLYDLASLNHTNSLYIETDQLSITSVTDINLTPVTVTTITPGLLYSIPFTQTGTGKKFIIKFQQPGTPSNCGNYPVSIKLAKGYNASCTSGPVCTRTDVSVIGTCNVFIAPVNVQLSIPGCYVRGSVLSPVVTGTLVTPTYQWYKDGAIIPGATQSTYTPTVAASYFVMITDGPCNYPSNSIALLVANAGADVAICQGGETILAGSGGGTYNWSPTASLTTASNIPNPKAHPTQTTVYTLTVSNGVNCSTDDVTVTVNPLPNVNGGADVIRCYDGTTSQLNASGAVSYSWTPTTGLTNSNTATPTVGPGPIIDRTYTVVGTDNNGCQNSDQVYVYIAAPPAVSAGSDKVVCDGGPVVSLNGSSPTGNYSWSPSTGLSATNVANPIVTAYTTPPYSTTYTLTSIGTMTIAGTTFTCTVTDQVLVDVKPLPAVSAGNDVAICLGQTATLNASGASTYSWSPISGLSNPSSATPSVGPTPAGLTTYTVTGTLGGCSNTDQVVVRITQLPPVNAGPDVTICSGSTGAVLNGSGTMGCSWSPSTGLSSTTSCTPTANPISQTVYALTTSGPWGCTNTDYVTVNVIAAGISDPYPKLIKDGTLLGKDKYVVQLGTLNGVTVTNYVWQYASNAIGTYTVSSACTGSYCYIPVDPKYFWKVTVTYSINGTTCTKTSPLGYNPYARIDFSQHMTDNVTVFPVPAYDLLNVEYNSDTTLLNMTMYDALGKEVLHQEINANETVVDVHDVPAGVYVIHFIDGRSVMHTKRVEILH